MQYSVFSSIKSYIPSENNDPAENYLTELIAWILSQDEFPDFRKDFIDFISPRFLKDILWTSFVVSTQFSIKGKYIDMLVIIDDKYHLIFEHKIYTDQHQIDGHSQIDYYIRNYINEYKVENDNIGGVYIAVKRRRYGNIKCCTWQDLFTYIETKIDLYPEPERYIVENLVNYIKESGYYKLNNIDVVSVENYLKITELESSLKSLFENNIKESIESSNKLEQVFEYLGNELTYEDRYKRRLGLSFRPRPIDWKPNIFVGIILNGYDHKLSKFMLTDKGLYASVILEYNILSENARQARASIEDLAKQLKDDLMIENEFTSVHIRDPRVWNNYRILVVLAPLIDIFGGRNDLIEQTSRLSEFYLKWILQITNHEAFKEIARLLKD